MSSPEKLSIGQQRKLDRKLLKLQHVLKKETGVSHSPNPSVNLAICNAGLVSGLTEESIYEHFSQHGPLKDIRMLPGKSCCFVSYENVNDAIKAYEAFNGKLNIAQGNKPVYLLYVNELSCEEDDGKWGKLPPGLILFEDFITDTEEQELLNTCNFTESCGTMKHRQVKHFGYEFRYDINNVDKDKPLDELLPSQTKILWPRLQLQDFPDFIPDQLTVNQYSPGQGIPHHVDTHSAFEDPIVCLSLGSPIVMEFKKDSDHYCVLLPRKSVLIMSGESRYNWTHGIVPRKFDIIRNKNGFTCLKRGTRVSYTFRRILRGPCTCIFKSKCDVFKEQIEIEDKVAEELEKLHVHQVYNNIADHFSQTRHKPWPQVLDFVQSFDYGDILIDVGCGNGKYLANNHKIFDIGCDRSSGLIEICRDKNFEAFLSDCLSIPLNDNTADGIISIAVIHHLANESRRRKAIKEMVRVLRPGGKALIYVWAHDQLKNQKKSSYIMQDRKNRKSDIDSHLGDSKNVTLESGNMALPVHTNRSNFQAKDLLVPWKKKSENATFLRFYHVFEENELEMMCQKILGIEIIKSYYDQGNWCVVIRKIS